MTNRVAQCSCGQLRATCAGEPALVSICNCDECRKRTGSAFGISAFFPREQVQTEGDNTTYTRSSESGAKITFHFCPTCGSSIYWDAERRPDWIAVAVGAFADPKFPMPRQSVWDERRHDWIEFPEEMATRTR
jgi:hypothetical protein